MRFAKLASALGAWPVLAVPKQDPDADEVARSRREILGKAALGAGASAAVLAGWPACASLFSKAQGDAASTLPFLDVAAESEIGTEPMRVTLRAPMRDGWLTMLRELGAAWLVRTPGGISALSAICPHLGCGVERFGSGYFCPCHESKFDALGERKSGPSPRGLDALAVRIEKGRVLVQPRMFGQSEPGPASK
jgi:Rieske Fe-S protein